MGELQSFYQRAKTSRAMLQTQQERDACAVILRHLRKLSPSVKQHWMKYQLALCDQAQKRELRQKLYITEHGDE